MNKTLNHGSPDFSNIFKRSLGCTAPNALGCQTATVSRVLPALSFAGHSKVQGLNAQERAVSASCATLRCQKGVQRTLLVCGSFPSWNDFTKPFQREREREAFVGGRKLMETAAVLFPHVSKCPKVCSV
jgi:hypothetical protein